MRFFKQICNALLTIWGVATVVFLLFQLLGDPSRLLMGQSGNAQTRARIQQSMELDRSGWYRYASFLNDLSPVSVYTPAKLRKKQIQGCAMRLSDRYWLVLKWPYLGEGYQNGRAVSVQIGEAFPATLLLATTAMILATFFGVGLGLLAGLNKESWIDRTLLSISVLGISAPSFFVAICLAYLGGVYWHAYTGLSFSGGMWSVDETTGQTYVSLRNLVLPAITLGIRPLAVLFQITRNAVLETLSMDFIRTAKAKGLPPIRIGWRHLLPNTLNPVVTTISGWFAELLAGSFFVEYIFGWKGLGSLTIQALETLDYPLISGVLIIGACFFIFLQFFSDWIVQLIDPRIKQ